MIRFLVDEDFNNDILRELRRRVPGVDALRIQALGLVDVSDETVLALVSKDFEEILEGTLKVPRDATLKTRRALVEAIAHGYADAAEAPELGAN